jgi:hypothetical protein
MRCAGFFLANPTARDQIVPLSDTTIRQAKPGVRAIKMFDGRGLFLLISTLSGLPPLTASEQPKHAISISPTA